MAEVFVWTGDDNPHPQGIKRGDIVEIRANDCPYGSQEGLPDFGVVKVPAITMAALKDKARPWIVNLDYEVTDYNLTDNKYTIKAFSDTYNSTSEAGGITLTKIQKFLAGWNAVLVSSSKNEIVFAFTIFDAIKSPFFWDVDISEVVFSELDYDTATGIHQVQADFSIPGNNPTYVERYVDLRGGEVISNSKRVIVFNIGKAVVLQAFKTEVKERH